MKKKYLFTMLVAVAVLLSCSKTNVPSLEDDALLNDDTRSESSNGGGGGMGASITPRTVVKDTLTLTEVPKDKEEKKDDIPSDTIPTDTIPLDSIPKDRITKNSFIKK